jgi:hypothetical protein
MFCRPLSALAGAAAILLLAGAAAQAFTFEDKDTANSGASARYTDQGDRTKSRLSGDSSDKSRYQSGNTSLQFGNRSSFDERYDSNRLFSPNNLMGK